jgi:hypothetical protein
MVNCEWLAGLLPARNSLFAVGKNNKTVNDHPVLSQPGAYNDRKDFSQIS